MGKTTPIFRPDPGRTIASATSAHTRLRVYRAVWGGLRAFVTERGDYLIGTGLYLLAAALLLYRIGGWPPYAYNWETYTAWRFFQFWDHPSPDIFRLTEGLMTDSGQSPLVALPVWLSFEVGGVGLASMRVGVALLAGLAVPLCWLVGRRLTGHYEGLLAAVLLAITPSFLLYGRTATLVGISLVPALTTVYVLLRYLREPARWGWLAALQGLLVAGAYAYAPVRLLWPVSLILIGLELVTRRGNRRLLMGGLAVTALALPAALVLLFYGAKQDPIGAINSYYYARGEQVAAFSADPQSYTSYLRLSPEERQQAQQGKLPGTPVELMARLMAQNAHDYACLLLDLNTRPVLTDHWNEHGRLYAGVLVPFFLAGFCCVLWRARPRIRRKRRYAGESEGEGESKYDGHDGQGGSGEQGARGRGNHEPGTTAYRALLVLFLGFSLPILLTSRVHVGRLIFALPLLMVIVACGYAWLIRLLDARVLRRWPVAVGRNWKWKLKLSVLVAGTAALVGMVAWSAWTDYNVPPSPTRENSVVALLRHLRSELRPGSGAGVALVDDDKAYVEGEVIYAGAYRLELDGVYRFVNLTEVQSTPASAQAEAKARANPGDNRPPLYFGGVLTRLQTPGSMPDLCGSIYLVTPAVEQAFTGAAGKIQQACGRPVRYIVLP